MGAAGEKMVLYSLSNSVLGVGMAVLSSLAWRGDFWPSQRSFSEGIRDVRSGTTEDTGVSGSQGYAVHSFRQLCFRERVKRGNQRLLQDA